MVVSWQVMCDVDSFIQSKWMNVLYHNLAVNDVGYFELQRFLFVWEIMYMTNTIFQAGQNFVWMNGNILPKANTEP